MRREDGEMGYWVFPNGMFGKEGAELLLRSTSDLFGDRGGDGRELG